MGDIRERIQTLGVLIESTRVTAALRTALNELEAMARDGDERAREALKRVMDAFEAEPPIIAEMAAEDDSR